MNNLNTGYMVVPMDLTEKQALIYMQMYKRCNFKDMTVKYTLEQLACDIKTTDIPQVTIYKNIKIMLEKGYLQLVKKASKGNAPVYKIVPIIEFNTQEEGKPKESNNEGLDGEEENQKKEESQNKKGKPTVNQEKTKGKPKHSNNEGLNGEEENQRKTKGKPKYSPIKEKENIYNNISKDILLVPKDLEPIAKKWNSLNLSKVTSIKNTRLKMLRARVNDYGMDKVLEAIDNISKSNFLKGQNDRGWTITFDWFIKPNNFCKVLEGNYNKAAPCNDKPKRRLIDEII